VKIQITPDGLCIELHGREQAWALRAKVSVMTPTITDVHFEPSFQDWRKWEIRMPGASIPGHLVAGSYWTEEGWDFLYITDPRGFIKPKCDNVLVIDTNQDRYKRVILSCDPDEGERIAEWWREHQKV
jgi:hypothetical protein